MVIGMIDGTIHRITFYGCEIFDGWPGHASSRDLMARWLVEELRKGRTIEVLPSTLERHPWNRKPPTQPATPPAKEAVKIFREGA